MPEKLLDRILEGDVQVSVVVSWLRGDNKEETLMGCSRSDLVVYLLSYLRNQTDSTVQPSGRGGVVLTPGGGGEHRRSISDPTHRDTPLSVSHSSHDKKRSRKVKTKLFTDERSKDSTLSSDESKLSTGIDRLVLTSTPLKNGVKEFGSTSSSPVTPMSRCDTPRSRPSRHERTLADYITSAHKTKKKRGRHGSDDSEGLDISSTEAFPEIGRKSSSLRSERRRIKPTNIDLSKKSVSLNSFNSESFQQPSPLALEDNAAFRAQDTQPSGSNFEAERSMLRQERTRLIEKFNSMSAATSPKCSTPLIKITPDTFDKVKIYVTPDVTKVTYKDKIDILVELYDTMLSYNLILTYNTELCFLISILLAKQTEEEYKEMEAKSKENITNYLLKTIHNATYFAVRSLYYQRSVLEVLLERQSLKLLGELKCVRAIGPELAKAVLNSYGVRCESETVGESETGSGVVVFQAETDNVDNFPSAVSFQSFKKQRDMFYEIYRWYTSTVGSLSVESGAPLRSRVRSLVGAGPTPHNMQHLARLLVTHLLGGGGGCTGVSRMSKLKRRLTQPSSGQEALFTHDDHFYREFLVCAESATFRSHVQDALATEILQLHHVAISTDQSTSELISACTVASRLGRFLSLLLSLPYSEAGAGGRALPSHTLTDTLLRNYVAVRSYYQPPLDLKSLLTSARESNRLPVTVTCVSHYLAVLDQCALRLPYYSGLLRMLVRLYTHVTDLYVKCTLGWLFGMGHVPQDVLYEQLPPPSPRSGPPSPSPLVALSPLRRELQQLLSGSRPAAPPRHVTPLRVGAVTNDKDLQSRLESVIVRGLSSSSRRALELVAERVSSRATRRLARTLHNHTHSHCGQKCDTSVISEIWNESRTHIAAAVPALVCAGAAGAHALTAVAARLARGKLQRGLRDYTTSGTLCPRASTALQCVLSPPTLVPAPRTDGTCILTPPSAGVAECIIDLKEQLCLILDRQPTPDLDKILRKCAQVVGTWDAARPSSGVKRTVVQLTADLCVLYACIRPQQLTEQFLQQIHCIWSVCTDPPAAARSVTPPSERPPPPGGSRAPTPDSDGEPGAVSGKIVIASSPTVAVASNADKSTSLEEESLPSIISRIVSPRNISLLSSEGEVPSWRAYSTLLRWMVTTGWVTDDELAARCVALYRHDWDANTVQNVSKCLRSVCAGVEGGASLRQFLGFLANYCADLAV